MTTKRKTRKIGAKLTCLHGRSDMPGWFGEEHGEDVLAFAECENRRVGRRVYCETIEDGGPWDLFELEPDGKTWRHVGTKASEQTARRWKYEHDDAMWVDSV